MQPGMKRYVFLIIAMIAITGCSPNGQSDGASLLDTHWNLVELDGVNVQHTGPQVPHLRFEADGVSGNDGCNNFFGAYTLDQNKLAFGLMAGTRMACPQIDNLDLRFNAMLSSTSRYQISGNRLQLLAEDRLLASFLAAEQP